VNRKVSLLILRVGRRNICPEAIPRIVDEYVDRSMGLSESRVDPSDIVGIVQVSGQRFYRHPVRIAELARHRIEATLVTGNQHKVCTASGELPGELDTYSRGGSGDEGASHADEPS
jgi:hypothetical protein